MIVETGRLINRRYSLQRLIKQGQVCAVYQGVDQVLQRRVAVKVVPSTQIATYKLSVRLTSQFSHPNIIGLYDLIVEQDALYAVQEFVEGDELAALQQTMLSPFEVADFGYQICQALIYAGSPSRRVCHGDLTPNSVIRDRSGLVRLNNFALPSDQFYFQNWSTIGNASEVLADADLPWGQQTPGRQANDTRAMGLLMYQLLGTRTNMMTVEPPADGRLRFQRGYPAELCELVARTLISQHPQFIDTPEALFNELKPLVEALEPETPPMGAQASPQPEKLVKAQNQFSPAPAAKLVSTLPQGGARSSFSNYSNYPNGGPNAPETSADSQYQFPNGQMQSFASEGESRHLSGVALLLIGLVIFALFFGIGFFLIHLFLH
ncbi:MAG TPA: protein kinase [Ktedonobacteraceae bacterium]|nr:protein kinase [Ktedonobacteraceae bacterium]